MDRHLRRLELLLLRAKAVPRHGPTYLTRPNLLEQLRLREVPIGDSPILALGQVSVEDPHLAHPQPAIAADLIPAHAVALAIALDVLLESVKREMGRRERQVREEGLAPMLPLVVLQTLDAVVSHRRCNVEAAVGIGRRQRLAVEKMVLGGEEAVVVLQLVGTLEAVPQGGAVNVPLAVVVAAVSPLPEPLRHERSPRLAAPQPKIAHGVPAYLLGVVPRQDGGTAGPTPARGVVLGVPQAPTSESVQVRGVDLAAVASGIREPHVISQDQQHIGAGTRPLRTVRHRGRSQSSNSGAQELAATQRSNHSNPSASGARSPAGFGRAVLEPSSSLAGYFSRRGN